MSAVALHKGKLSEHAGRIYRDEKAESDRANTREKYDGHDTYSYGDGIPLQMRRRKSCDCQKTKIQPPDKDREEMMIELAVSQKESSSLKEQFFKMKEYLQQLNEEIKLLRGEASAIHEITSIGRV